MAAQKEQLTLRSALGGSSGLASLGCWGMCFQGGRTGSLLALLGSAYTECLERCICSTVQRCLRQPLPWKTAASIPKVSRK